MSNNDVTEIRAAVDEARALIGVTQGSNGPLPNDSKLDAVVRALDLITDRLEQL